MVLVPQSPSRRMENQKVVDGEGSKARFEPWLNPSGYAKILIHGREAGIGVLLYVNVHPPWERSTAVAVRVALSDVDGRWRLGGQRACQLTRHPPLRKCDGRGSPQRLRSAWFEETRSFPCGGTGPDRSPAVPFACVIVLGSHELPISWDNRICAPRRRRLGRI